MRKSVLIAAVSCVALAVLVGCGGRSGSAFVVNEPDWPYQHYERIAVLPGQTAFPQAGGEAAVLSDRLTTLLTQNGQFTVLSRAELADVFKEQDLSHLADAVDQGTALPEGQIKVAQAIVVPKITDYKLIADHQEMVIPRFGVDRKGRPIKVGEDHVVIYRHGAEVEASVRIVDAATGKVLASHSARVIPDPATNRGRPPSASPQDVAATAVRELAVEFYKQIAPVRVKVKFKKDNLLLATEYFDGKYDKLKKVSPTLDKFLVVVSDLDEACDRNRFRVAVAEKDVHRNLFESDEFVWSPSVGPEGVAFDIPVAALNDAGGKDFVAKLYAVGNPEPVVERAFQLEDVKEK